MITSFISNRRSQVGIGTLIVFIAMVLVAAIGAGVLIQTGGFLQTSAQATGDQSTDQTTNYIEVFSTSGKIDEVYDIADDNVVLRNNDQAVTGDVVDSDEVKANIVAADGANVVYDYGQDRTEDSDGDKVTNGGSGTYKRNTNGTIDDLVDDLIILGSGNNIVDQGPVNIFVDDGSNTNVIADFDATFTDNTAVKKNDQLDEISLTIGKGPGSGDISLDDITIQYRADHGTTTLVREGTTSAAGSDTFTVTTVKSDVSDDVIVDRGDRFRITIALDGADDEPLRPLRAAERVDLTLMTTDGTVTTQRLQVANTLGTGERIKSIN